MKQIKLLIVLVFLIFSTNANALTQQEKDIRALAKAFENASKNTAIDVVVSEGKQYGYLVLSKTFYLLLKHSGLNPSTLIGKQALIRSKIVALATQGASNPLKKANALTWIFLYGDVIENIIKELYFPNKEAQQALLDVLYGNLKASIEWGLATNVFDKAGAGLTWLETNGKALYVSTVGIAKLYAEKSKLDASNMKLEAFGKILKLRTEYEKKYAKASFEKKESVANEFQYKCYENTKDDSFIFVNKKYNKFQKAYCKKITNQIIMFNKVAYYNLFGVMRQNKAFFYDKAWVEHYVETHFLDSQKQVILDRYYKLKNAETYDPDVSANVHKYYYKYLKRIKAYGIAWRLSNGEFKYKLLSEQDVYQYIYGASKNIKNKLRLFLLTKDFNKDKKVTEVDTADLLVKNFKLKEKLTQTEWRNILIISKYFKKETVSSLILKHFKIINSKTILRKKYHITSTKLLKWIVNALDINKCGYIGCDYSSILNIPTRSYK